MYRFSRRSKNGSMKYFDSGRPWIDSIGIRTYENALSEVSWYGRSQWSGCWRDVSREMSIRQKLSKFEHRLWRVVWSIRSDQQFDIDRSSFDLITHFLSLDSGTDKRGQIESLSLKVSFQSILRTILHFVRICGFPVFSPIVWSPFWLSSYLLLWFWDTQNFHCDFIFFFWNFPSFHLSFLYWK